MQWIALRWLPESLPPGAAAVAERVQPPDPRSIPGDRPADDPSLGWWALQWTPHVVPMGRAWLLEVSASQRLWGGLRSMMQRIAADHPASARLVQAHGHSSLAALAALRLRVAGRPVPPPEHLPRMLPLSLLDAARPHLPVLRRLGCRNWGQAHDLPRDGAIRRFGPGLRGALDVAFGLALESHVWLRPPEHFDQSLELPVHVRSAPAMLWSAARLLERLQEWLRLRRMGVLAVELSWTFDRDVPGGQSALLMRMARPAQSRERLSLLLAERLARMRLAAPATRLRLRALETTPWQESSHSLLADERDDGSTLEAFIERASARLGDERVVKGGILADHRPEQRQRWWPVSQPAAAAGQRPARSEASGRGDALMPTWLLCRPLPLAVQAGRPLYHGPLQLLTRAQRIESGWWPQQRAGAGRAPDRGALAPGGTPEGQACRDYYIAQNPRADLLWVFCERPTAARPGVAGGGRWFLHGLYG